jgi:hypothetical protein
MATPIDAAADCSAQCLCHLAMYSGSFHSPDGVRNAATECDRKGPDNYVVQSASFCLSKINDFVQNFVQNAVFVSIFPGLRLYFKTEILVIFRYILVLC